MEVSIVTRVDFPDKFLTEKLKRFFLSPDAESINTEFFNQKQFDILERLADIYLPRCRSIDATSLLLEWESLGNDWETVYEITVRSLRELNSTVEVSVVSGDDGWYQLFTQVLDKSKSLNSWQGKELDEIFDSKSNFVPIINEVTKALTEENKTKLAVFKKNYFKNQQKPKTAVKPKRKSKYLPDIDEPEYFAKHWQSDNDEWMEQRIKDWRPFADRLERLRKKNKQAFKFHMEMFFQGTCKGFDVFIDGKLNPEMNTRMHNSAFKFGSLYGGNMWPIYFLWYHPKPETIDLGSFRQSAARTSSWFDLRQKGLGGRTVSPSDFLGYGSVINDSFADRGEWIVKFVVPSYEKDETVTLPADPTFSSRPAEELSVGTQNIDLVRKCNFATKVELAIGKRYESYVPGQFMWGHVSYAMANYPESMHCNLKTEHRSKDIADLIRTIAEILNFHNRTDDSRNRPSTIAMVDRLIAKYESKEFSKPMLELWDSAKENLDELLKEEFRV